MLQHSVILTAGNEGADQAAHLRNLICAFVARLCDKVHFLKLRLILWLFVGIGSVMVLIAQNLTFYACLVLSR